MIFQGSNRYPVTEAVLHCAAINTGQFKGWSPYQIFLEINRWHKQRGFAGFGYHGLITPEGDFYMGRPYTVIGAHCIERNRGSVGFLLIESKKIDRIGTFDDWFTPAQRERLQWQLSVIPGLTRVSGHNDYAAKLCPGFKVKTADWLGKFAPSFPPSGDNFVTK